MDEKKKLFVILTAILSLVSVGLNSAAFATDHWIKGRGNTSNGTRAGAVMSFGLFKGIMLINYGVSDRDKVITVTCDTSYCLLSYSKPGDGKDSWKLSEAVNQFQNQTSLDGKLVYSRSLEDYDFALFPTYFWALTIAFMALGIAFSLVYIGFASFNVCAKPIETISGPLGLYMWNVIAIVFCLLAVIIYAVLYEQKYTKNVMSRSDKIQGFQSEVSLDYSFYLSVAAMICHVINLYMLMLSGVRFTFRDKDDIIKEDVTLSGMY
ncbi:hypothetical protein FSP39_002596 [Pinctada imbricata]|uniref:Clarin-3 n=1 Tax=Pinctada imbricata TaxID=66713 RepID=A0AA88YH10_PINIB|nr:hypothetical protein FSP39_002596 [Pinctada imbricata]